MQEVIPLYAAGERGQPFVAESSRPKEQDFFLSP
jgi:hypothetical protein